MAKLVQPDIALDAVWWRDRVSRRRGVGPYEPDAPTTYYSSGTEVHYIISFAFIDVMGASYGQCSGASNCGFGSEYGRTGISEAAGPGPSGVAVMIGALSGHPAVRRRDSEQVGCKRAWHS